MKTESIRLEIRKLNKTCRLRAPTSSVRPSP